MLINDQRSTFKTLLVSVVDLFPSPESDSVLIQLETLLLGLPPGRYLGVLLVFCQHLDPGKDTTLGLKSANSKSTTTIRFAAVSLYALATVAQYLDGSQELLVDSLLKSWILIAHWIIAFLVHVTEIIVHSSNLPAWLALGSTGSAQLLRTFVHNTSLLHIQSHGNSLYTMVYREPSSCSPCENHFPLARSDPALWFSCVDTRYRRYRLGSPGHLTHGRGCQRGGSCHIETSFTRLRTVLR